jgi:hypothetical protein
MRNRKVSFVGMLCIAFIVANSQTAEAQTTNGDSLLVPEFSVKHGFYTQSFDVIVSAETTNASIKYTLDGSDPRTSPTALVQTSPATVRIDPESTEGQRGKTPGVILRACTLAPDFSASETITQTYLFVGKVGALSPDRTKPGPNWPNPTYSPQYIDYGMDPDVLNDPRYKDLIDDALLAIPTISIATDLKNLFDPAIGIYVNAMSDGMTWERPASIELLNPDGSEGFQIDAGLRIRGGWSRHGDNPKHAFRLFFRSEYGKGKLTYPLFESEGTDKFDALDIRTSQNYSWSYPGHQSEYNTMNRDVFCRDLQREIGQPYTRSRFYHLYLDGVYWGLFQSQERSEASYAATYFGGIAEDYDVIKPGDNYSVDATDGNTDAYHVIWNMCLSGFQNNDSYFRLQGLNADGTRNPTYNVLVDIDNLIDFMLIIFYGGNFDSPTSKFGNNKGANNFFCIYNRNGREGFKFLVHDAEHTLRTTAGEGAGVGLYENRVNIGQLSASDPYQMVVSQFSSFHPQWLHFKLSVNPEYRLRFADHVYKHFFNQGCMTPAKATALFLSRAKEIEMAIIGESARWGDISLNPPGTKDDTWQPAVDDIVYNYFPNRTGIVLGQLKQVQLYPGIDPPVFVDNNGTVSARSVQVESGYKLKLTNPNSTRGTIRYTVDGQDPRLIGGSTAGSAMDGGNEVEITANSTTVIKARVRDGATWSAIHEIILFVGNNASDLKVTEIHYHPLDADTVSDNEYEFLELKNIGAAPVNLSGALFVGGITYTFPSGTIVNPAGFIVLASNRQEFNNRYGFLPFGEYSGQLDNGGETITLCTAGGDTIFTVLYDDQAPWPDSADGLGYSLVTKVTNPSGDLNDPANWRTSYAIHGSPGRDDPSATSVETPTTGLPTGFSLHQNYPNPFNPETKIHYTLKSSGKVRLSVYDLLGREVAVLAEGFQSAGGHDVRFSGAGQASGIYFYRLQTADGVITRKMTLVR